MLHNYSPTALLTEEQAAELLALSVRTLQAWRLRGAGPRYVRAGRAIRYQQIELVEWISANTVTR
ncbi:helix-turn-helix domain-containing protein [Bradyrhizobium sp. JYMT SZCCT0180]|uniref:helix-turn-helix transcriptional regulator n=1 Tax=Bradyrhizobium sp. JYMT SZCCT0180 TaxID=2807666 RepID=UPI001BA87509|nr:helix-turn-helix domain-containing protein [Bradyrhizobium sp. JYMT SZCCT0180]MBR1216214.1 helix-turn-helix domain-containing protein [Bradyrhizobium sp. JYMT SZCCT0180]